MRVVRAQMQQTVLVQMLGRVRAMRTAAAPETLLATGKFQIPTRRGTPARSEVPRAEPPLKQTVREVHPAWELPVLVAEPHVPVAAPARGDRAMNKRKNI
jgi:hypothetical protein